MNSFSIIYKTVNAGVTVHWKSPAYRVIRTRWGDYQINCTLSGSCIGLHEPSHNPQDFYIPESEASK